MADPTDAADTLPAALPEIEPEPALVPVVPGALRGRAWLTLQTRRAQTLVRGSAPRPGRSAVVGLGRFGREVGYIAAWAAAGELYARWWVERIERGLGEAECTVAAIGADAQRRLASIEGVEFEVARSVEPLRLLLDLGHPLAFRGAYLVAAYDRVARTVLTARHVGLTTQEEGAQLLDAAFHPVRRSQARALGYRFLGVKAEDVVEGSARYREAVAVMGELPRRFVDGGEGDSEADESDLDEPSDPKAL
ncbi:MAG: TIGR03761 family integrating conjugative element protein [Chromatiales bacterium]|nr:TIGR03761 family integrating conjugative element protein [Chromatiales bacterium]